MKSAYFGMKLEKETKDALKKQARKELVTPSNLVQRLIKKYLILKGWE